jgi:hypothetical protein
MDSGDIIKTTPGGTAYDAAPLTPPPAPVRPGWQTTEFWLTFGKTAVAVAIAFGAVSADDRDHIETAVLHGIEAVAALVVAAWVVISYTRERTTVKLPPEKFERPLPMSSGPSNCPWRRSGC